MINIGLISIGNASNIKNIENALIEAGSTVTRLDLNDNFNSVDKLVIPGVGSFYDYMQHIGDKKTYLFDEIQKKPTLGICLGMQILATIGFEYGEADGLCLFDGEVRRMEVKAKTPHMGWNTLIRRQESPLLRGIAEEDSFYFMHSYEVVNYTDIVALTEYHGHRFVSMIQKDNLFGVQFHPEKSRSQGIRLLKNFIEL